MSDLIGKKIKVLDDGFVQLIDYFGSDEDIAAAARVSYSKGTKTARDDEALVRYLMKNEHYSPFGQVQIKIHIRLPIFVHNQFIRHDRFVWNVMSARYSIMPEEKWNGVDEWRIPSSTNKQAGEQPLGSEESSRADEIQSLVYQKIDQAYNDLLNLGVCREQARTVLPMGQYTEGFVTANLGDWMLFLKRRMDHHAQKEIRDYADEIFKILFELFPVSMQAFLDYQYNAVTFSQVEINALKEILSKNIDIFNLSPTDRANFFDQFAFENKKERIEFLNKLKK